MRPPTGGKGRRNDLPPYSAAVTRNLLQAVGLKTGRSARPGEQSRMAPANQWRLTGVSVTGRMAGSTVRRALATSTLPRVHVATRHAAQRPRAIELSSWAARGCVVNRHPGRPSHPAVPASHAACVAPPSTPPTHSNSASF